MKLLSKPATLLFNLLSISPNIRACRAICLGDIVLDYAKAKARQKRGAGARHIALDEAPPISDEKAAELIALDEALQELAKRDARKAEIVELRFFGGYSVKEVAELLEVSESTVAKDWQFAKDWLGREIAARLKGTSAIRF